MSVIDFSMEHGASLDEARRRLRTAVSQVQGMFPAVVQSVSWSPDETSVKLIGKGFDLQLRVDAVRIYASGNVTLLGGLLSGKLAAGLKQILQRTVAKRLP